MDEYVDEVVRRTVGILKATKFDLDSFLEDEVEEGEMEEGVEGEGEGRVEGEVE